MKYRRPWLMPIWMILTAGIYWFYWHWKVNRELRNVFQMTVGPFLSLLAVTIGWILVFPPFVAWWRLLGRIEEAQRRRGIDPPTIVKPVGFILFSVTAIVFLLMCFSPIYTGVEGDPLEFSLLMTATYLALIFGPIYAQAELNKAWRRR